MPEGREGSVSAAPIETKRRSALLSALVVLVVLAAVWLLGRGPSTPASLLTGLHPSASRGVAAPHRVTDGLVAPSGDPWHSTLGARMTGRRASVTYDLSTPRRIRAAFLQGDDNDTFRLEGSLDGRRFTPLWQVPAISGGGMRERSTSSLDAQARYLRLVVTGGDASVSVSELQVFSERPRPWPPRPSIGRGSSIEHQTATWIVGFGALAVLLLLLHQRRGPVALRIALPLLVLAVGALATWRIAQLGAAPQHIVDLLRAVIAVIAAAAVLRLALRPRDTEGSVVTGALALMAVGAVLTFYNLGYPQFSYTLEGRRTYVHTWDMRVYFPIAKYFDELAFDGLYVASVQAHLEDAPNATVERLAATELRDLETYEMTTVARSVEAMQRVKARFSPERWAEFKEDMAFFRRTMGGGYLASLRDHGGNATPVWLLVAHLLFRWADASEATLMAAAALDPALLLLFFIVAWRTFGARTALLCMIVYGTTTFPWFGSNWAGSTLRNDWMALLGLATCALAERRWFTGGALLAWSALVRAFPVLAVAFLAVPPAWWLVDRWRASRRLPSAAELRAAQRPFLRASLGAIVCVVALGLLSAATLGPAKGWGQWAEKISRHSTKPNINHVGWRAVVGTGVLAPRREHEQRLGWSEHHRRNVSRSRGVFLLGVGLAAALALLACRGRSLAEASLVGIMMVPFWLYPSNYYLHFVFVLPALGALATVDRARWWWGWIGLVLLGLSYVEYFGFHEGNIARRYAEWSWSMLGGFMLILAPMAWRGWRLSPAAAAAAAESAAGSSGQGDPL